MPFNKNMLNLARELRAMTQATLADKSGVSQAKISKFGSGFLVPTDEELAKLATSLDLPVAFFEHGGPRPARGTTCLYHRKKATALVRDSDRVQAQFTYLRMQLEELLTCGIKVDAKRSIYQIDVDAMDGDVEAIAAILRQTWAVPPGPMDNLTLLLEHSGAIVVRVPFYSDDISAMSFWPDSGSPVVFVNASSPGDRLRWSLAHELGHLIMHVTPTGDLETEADRFASEFLMPRSGILTELSSGPLTIQKLAAMKMRWKVSIQAIIRRAFDLEVITHRQYRTLMMRISQMGWRKKEPVHVEPEVPTVLPSIINHYLTRKKYSCADLSKLCLSLEPQFRREFLCEESSGNGCLRLVK